MESIKDKKIISKFDRNQDPWVFASSNKTLFQISKFSDHQRILGTTYIPTEAFYIKFGANYLGRVFMLHPVYDCVTAKLDIQAYFCQPDSHLDTDSEEGKNTLHLIQYCLFCSLQISGVTNHTDYCMNTLYSSIRRNNKTCTLHNSTYARCGLSFAQIITNN